MKTKFTKITAIILALVTVFALTAYAASNSKNIEIFYRNIKIMIDGAEYIAKDVNGNVVEPFIYNGTTYLPVRGIANAFGKDVIWDGANATVYLGKKDRNAPDNRLDKIQYSAYREDYKDNEIQLINGTVTDYNGNDYTNGLLFVSRAYDYDNTKIELDYPLNGQYETLCGTIVLPQAVNIKTISENSCYTAETTVVILGEDEDELFRIDGVTQSMPYKFEINVKGVNKITIKVTPEVRYNNLNRRYYVALADLALYE